MKAISLTYIPMPPQIYICSTGVFRPPFKLAPRHFHLFTSHLAQCLGHGECLINALCDDKHVFSDTTHSVSTSLPGTKVRHTYLYFSAFRVAVAICQVWSTVPICNKLHILANSSTILPLSSFRTLGWRPSVPVIYLHPGCHSRTSCPFTTTCSNALGFSVFKYNWGWGWRIFLFTSYVTANAKDLP